MIDLGWVRPGQDLYIPFNTFDSNDPSASAAPTGFAAADIEVYRDGDTTQRASDTGYTATASFDTTTGVNLIQIDLSSDATAGFFRGGGFYMVVVNSITVDAAAIQFCAATFRIGYDSAFINTYMDTRASQTSFTIPAAQRPADNDALNGWVAVIHDIDSAADVQVGYVSDYVGATGTVTLAADPGIFTTAANDGVYLYPPCNVGAIESGLTIGTVTNVTNGVTLAAGAVTDASLAGNMEIVFETDFATNYNATRNAWATNVQDTVGTGTLGLNDLSTADVNAEADTALTDFFTSPATLVDLVWDEELTGATHAVPNSAGRRLRQLQESGSAYGGYIWIDTINGANPATPTDYEDGTSDNPVNNMDDANTLAASVGIDRFKIAPGSSITLTASQSNEVFEGENWTLALGSQAITNTVFHGATVSGIGTGSGYTFYNSSVGTVTLADGSFRNCGLSGTFTASAAASYFFDGCYSEIAGAGTWTFDFAAVGNTNLNMRHHSGGTTINNKNATGTDLMSLEGDGQLVVAASSSGAISVRGNFNVTNTGGATITYDDNQDTVNTISTEIGTAGAGLTNINLPDQTMNITGDITGNLSGSVGSVTGNVGGNVVGSVASVTAVVSANVTQVEGQPVNSPTGTASGTPTTTTMVSDITVTVDDQFNGRTIIFDDDTATTALRNQATDITACTAATDTLTFTALTTAPSSGDTFRIA